MSAAAVRVLLVAKPWRGGLAAYLAQTLEGLWPGATRWIHTYPTSASERAVYARDRHGWRARLAERIASSRCEVALFINHLPALAALPPRAGYVLWLTDAARFARGELDPYARVFVSDPGYAATVRDALPAGRFAGVVPFAHLPSLHRPMGVARRPRDVCFLGNRDPARDTHLERLLGLAYRCTVAGNYWGRSSLFWRHPFSVRPGLPVERAGAFYARHRLSLNVHAAVVRAGTNMRTFECAGYGIPQLVDNRPGLEKYFEPGREIAVYDTADELGEAIGALLADREGSARMARRARQRVLAEHTYEDRVRVLFDGLLAMPARVDAARSLH